MCSRKVLVANRGEIAIRIFRTLRELGVGIGRRLLRRRSRRASTSRYADEAYALGGLTAAESYLVVDKLLEAAASGRARRRYIPATDSSPRTPRSRAPSRARARLDRAAARRDRADGLEDARAPGDAGGRRADHPRHDRPGRLGRGGRARSATEIGYPLLIKAAAGGGGKGMKVVDSAERGGAGVRVGAARGAVVLRRRVRLRRAVPRGPAARRGAGARRRARQRRSTSASATARSSAATRSSSRRRRRRRSTPSCASGSARSPSTPRAPPATARPGRSRACSTPDGDYFFMEMNTRIQVEHTVTELVTGLDLVREQVLDRARASRSRFARRTSSCAATRSSAGSTPRIRRTASCRRPGTITRYREPAGPGVRVDSGVAAGSEISGLYDPMIAKLIVHDTDREDARRRMLRALGEFEIGGVDDAARLPPGAARASVLRRGRDVPRHRRVARSWRERAARVLAAGTTVAAAADGLRRVGRARRQWPRSTAAASR